MRQRSFILLRTLLNRYRTKPLILVMLGLCSCGSGLGSLQLGNLGSTAAVIYSIDGNNHRVLRYTPNDLGTATLDSAIQLPAGVTATLVTTDASGNLYLGSYTNNAKHSEVLVYDSGATDGDQPLRTLQLAPGKLTALAVDRQGVIYAAQLNTTQQATKATINIYSSNFGEDMPIRTIAAVTFADLNDLTVDSAGNIYVSGTNGSASFIREFSSTASSDATAIRTVWAPKGSSFGGLAVDDGGNIFAMLGLTICKLKAGDSGTPEITVSPIQSINLPSSYTAYSSEALPNVLRRDGLGDFFVSVTMTGPDGSANMVYGFASNAGGDATPMLQFIAADATASGPHDHNIPLAVF